SARPRGPAFPRPGWPPCRNGPRHEGACNRGDPPGSTDLPALASTPPLLRLAAPKSPSAPPLNLPRRTVHSPGKGEHSRRQTAGPSPTIQSFANYGSCSNPPPPVQGTKNNPRPTSCNFCLPSAEKVSPFKKTIYFPGGTSTRHVAVAWTDFPGGMVTPANASNSCSHTSCSSFKYPTDKRALWSVNRTGLSPTFSKVRRKATLSPLRYAGGSEADPERPLL